MDAKDQLRRMLLLDSVLSLGGIIVATLMYVAALQQQEIIAEDLYRHPFTVSNAALELKMDVLALRNRMLELAVGDPTVGKARADAYALQLRISAQLETIQSFFLGDLSRVDRIKKTLAEWSADREAIYQAFDEGHPDMARQVVTQAAAQHVGQILEDNEYVISFARGKAAEIVGEGKAKQIRNQWWVVLGAVLVATAYVWIAQKRRRAVYALFDQVHVRATYDDLTGARNRQSFVEHASVEIERSLRLNNQLSLIVIDIDHFKQINDEHGHASGDVALRAFGAICKGILRKIDTFGRLGGEEFGVLLPSADLQEALAIAERIRRTTEESAVQSDGTPVKMTISAGVAQLGSLLTSLDQLIRAADMALYQAKHAGRNQVAVAK